MALFGNFLSTKIDGTDTVKDDYVRERISVHNDEICRLSWLDRPNFVRESHRIRGLSGRCLDHSAVRHSCLTHQPKANSVIAKEICDPASVGIGNKSNASGEEVTYCFHCALEELEPKI
jgi:hypothetical protein